MSAEPACSWTDTHCHIQETYLEDPTAVSAVVERASEAGVRRLVCVGTGAEASKEAMAVAARLSSAGPALIWATVGLHPHEASQGTDAVARIINELPPAGGARTAGSVVGVGECGLDYFYEHSPRDSQRSAFAEQIELARRHDLALVVHSRDAWDDTLSILNEAGVPDRTVIHCFTGGPEQARRCLEIGAYLSFSGIVTFKNADSVREAVAVCPLDRMLVETDSPFLAPVPHRGKRNEPALVAIVGEAIAELRGVAAEDLAATTTANAAAVFSLAA